MFKEQRHNEKNIFFSGSAALLIHVVTFQKYNTLNCIV